MALKDCYVKTRDFLMSAFCARPLGPAPRTRPAQPPISATTRFARTMLACAYFVRSVRVAALTEPESITIMALSATFTITQIVDANWGCAAALARTPSPR